MNISDYIVPYIEWLTREISLYTTEKKVKFGIWCIWPIINENDVSVFLDKINGDATSDFIKNVLKLIWNDSCDVETIIYLMNYVDRIDWDNDLIERDEQDSAQGLIDLLGGISCLTHGYLDNSNEYIANCAELAINRIDYLIGAEKIGVETMDKEIAIQKNIVELFGKGDELPSLQYRKRWPE
ncbi:hypothetical protein ACP7OL_004838 [Salmonella enterica subsp. enterica]